MTVTNTVTLDLDGDFTYEDTITSDVLSGSIRRGRNRDLSQANVGTLNLVLRNEDGRYSPLNSSSAIYPDFHPGIGVRVTVDSQNRFTGFVRAITQNPTIQHSVRVECFDWLGILGRTDVSQPLMRDVQTGIYINRIADLAEVSELVTNPRFRDDTTNYAGLSGGTITRMTTGKTLEGGTAGRVVSGGASQGVRYTITAATAAGQKVQASVYVWADDDASVGDTCTLGITDNLGSRGTATVTLSHLPQRITVSGTYDAGSTARYLDVTTTTSSNFRIGVLHCVAFSNAIPRSVDAGVMFFGYVGPRRVRALSAIQQAAEEELGGLVYVDRSGTLVFEERDHRWESDHLTSQGTIDEAMIDLTYEESIEDLVGLVEVDFTDWELGDPLTTIFSLFPVPRAISPNGTLTLNIDYGAFARDVVKPVANTDYTINANRDGGGADESGNVTLAFEDYGGGAQAIFTNTVARTVFLTTFGIRGTPVRIASDTPEVTYTPTGAPRFASKLALNYSLMDSRAHADSWATYIGDRYVTQRERLPVALVNKTAAMTTQQVSREISDRVTITNDNTAYSAKVNGAYYIDAINEQISAGATLLLTTWEVVPVDASMFIWDSSSWDGPDVWGP